MMKKNFPDCLTLTLEDYEPIIHDLSEPGTHPKQIIVQLVNSCDSVQEENLVSISFIMKTMNSPKHFVRQSSSSIVIHVRRDSGELEKSFFSLGEEVLRNPRGFMKNDFSDFITFMKVNGAKESLMNELRSLLREHVSLIFNEIMSNK